MQQFDPGFTAALSSARDVGNAPVYFFWVVARNREGGAPEPMGLWSGDEDIAVNVQTREGGLTTRTYLGGCNLSIPGGIPLTADGTDRSLTVNLSQIADATQQLVRGYDVRLAYCEVHSTSRDGGALVSAPQLQWIGIVDDVQIETPAVGGEGRIGLTVRSELITQLMAANPAKSSDSHQKRRQAGDLFSRDSSTVSARNLQWYKKE